MFLNIDEERVVPALQEAGEKLDCAQGEAILDFSSVRRIDSSALRAMEEFARIADEKAVKVVLRGVNVDVYKVLKLVKLDAAFFLRELECALVSTTEEEYWRAEPPTERPSFLGRHGFPASGAGRHAAQCGQHLHLRG